MPPSVCTQSLPLRNAASNASAAAAAIARPPPLSASSHGAGRVPHRGARELGARQHVGAAVLHALELPDRTAELHAHLRVLGRGVDAPLRDADRLGREQHRRDVAHPLRREAGEPPVGRRAARRRGRAAATRRVRSMLGSSVAASVGSRRARTTRRRSRTRSRRRRARRAPVARRSSATAPVHSPAASFGSHSSAAAPPASSSTAAAIAVGDVRPGRARPAELLDHDRLLDEAVAGAAVRLVDVQAEPARLAQRGPERGPAPRARRRPRRATAAGGMRVSTKRRTAWRSSSCSSVIPIGMRGMVADGSATGPSLPAQSRRSRRDAGTPTDRRRVVWNGQVVVADGHPAGLAVGLGVEVDRATGSRPTW